ncbi:MAG: iron export ABC transporter permease subunit FetB [Gammaproteobacteria bacterium]
MTPPDLSFWTLSLAALLVLANAGLSLLLQLGIARQLLIAAARMCVQLALIGLVLTQLFARVSLGWTALAALVMLAVAGYEVRSRQERRLRGWWSYGLGSSTMLLATVLVTLLALTVLLQPDPWYHPRYALPLLGMILGNAMTGVSLGLNALTTGAVRERLAIEAQLALGATRWQALLPLTRQALRTGFMPIINSMAATGLVALPGMMTGQILAGADPAEAVKYQLLIMFLIAGATGSGVLLVVLGGIWRLTDERHRLRLDRLQRSE